MKKAYKVLTLLFSMLFILCLSAAFLPAVQRFTIHFVEVHRNDDINDVFWAQQMFAFASLGIIAILLFDFILLSERGRKLFLEFIGDIGAVARTVGENKKYLLLLMGLYFLGYFSIIRANYSNYPIDDLARQLRGSREWVNFYRYVSEIGSIFVHTSMRIFDVAPLTQFIAIFFISLASFFIIHSLTDGDFSPAACIASLPAGLFPFYLSNFSYRYDSPYMAFSILVSVTPFMFLAKKRSFIISSVLCLFLMCTSYQASSGIYVFMAILHFLKMLTQDKGPLENWDRTAPSGRRAVSAKALASFTVTSVLCYVATLLFFSFLFIEKIEEEIYVDMTPKLSMLLPNSIAYIKKLVWGLGKSSTLRFSALLPAVFLYCITKRARCGRLPAFALSLAGLAVSLPLTYGSYIALARPEFYPRAFAGIGVFMGCLGAMSVSLIGREGMSSRLVRAATFCLSYCCIAFAFAFGNAQCAQKEYIRFRGTLLAQDLSEFIREGDRNIELKFVDSIGYARKAELLTKIYPLTTEAMDIGLSRGSSCELILESMNLIRLQGKSSHDYDGADMPVLKETAYHTIQGRDGKFLITLRSPDIPTLKDM
ncbi:MAG: glucosyltransferase domain-containing protein [Treponema sp.]|nr:glucosyltransferase domain-containing protein [Treponema sp.]